MTIGSSGGGLVLVAATTGGQVSQLGAISNASAVSSSLLGNVSGLAYLRRNERLYAVTDRGQNNQNWLIVINPCELQIVDALPLIEQSGSPTRYRDAGFTILGDVGYISAANGNLGNDPLWRVDLRSGRSTFITSVDDTQDLSGPGNTSGLLRAIDHGADDVVTISPANGSNIDEEGIRDGDISSSAGAAGLGSRFFAVNGRRILELVGDLRDNPELRLRANLPFSVDNLAAIAAISDDCSGQVCTADTNNDGVINPADFNAWILAFNNRTPECDQNADGLCNPADFNAWVANFNAGC
ncbi:MAG: GC-type dockerin domain-anchored protein [Planctomycetota bacterium]